MTTTRTIGRFAYFVSRRDATIAARRDAAKARRDATIAARRDALTAVGDYVRADGTPVRAYIKDGVPAVHAVYGPGIVYPTDYAGGGKLVRFVVRGSGRVLTVGRSSLAA